MGKVIGIDGQPLPSTERVEPKMLLDASDGLFSIPVVVITDFQFNALVNQITQKVTEAILDKQVLDEIAEPVEGELQIPLDGIFQSV